VRDGGRLEPPAVRSHLRAAAAAAGLAVATAVVALTGPPAGRLFGPEWSWARVPLALIALILLPGYGLATLVYPRGRDLDPLGRLGLAVGLSLAHVAFWALVADRLPTGLTPESLVAVLTLTMCFWTALALLRLSTVPAAERVSFAYLDPRGVAGAVSRRWSRTARRARAELAIGLALIGVVAWLIGDSLLRHSSLPLTEFFILGRGLLAEQYPVAVTPGERV